MNGKEKKTFTNDLQYIKGIGPKRAEALFNYGIRDIKDLLYYIPFRYFDRSRVLKIKDIYKNINSKIEITIVGKVIYKSIISSGANKRLIIKVSDGTGNIDCVWFGGINYFIKIFNTGDFLAVSGIPTIFNNTLQIVHPDYDKLSDEEDFDFLNTGSIIPHYRTSEELKKSGIDSKSFRRIFKNIFDSNKIFIEEFLNESIIKRNNLLSINEALRNVHFPKSNDMLEKALFRLKFDELFLLQLLVFQRKKKIKIEKKGIKYNIKSSLARKLVDSLNFNLTSAQKKAINEILNDMNSEKAMNRMLQGDVGSGKTIVALIAMLVAIENGYQTALMVPTEILCEQHYSNILNYLKDFNLNIRVLIGGQNKRLRNEVLEDIREGRANIVIGTHALIEENVIFKNLSLIIIDEQHRFGVMQRALLREKGIKADVLVMTATPIPRTLSLTLYGELDLSIINELPKGRKPIKTYLVKESNIDKLYRFIKEQVNKSSQAYIVYPLIEESEKLDLEAATKGYNYLREHIFPDLRIGLIHSKLFSYEKDDIMTRFKNKEIDILVATTVIEVGIDVPNANIMVIMNAERFGLSQLHQLRGRVGRGADQSYCFLVTKDYLVNKSERQAFNSDDDQQIAIKRLNTMISTNDGFKIAEVDLEIRGPGDFFGTRQTGIPNLEIANLFTDENILEIARKEAKEILTHDPDLSKFENQRIKRIFLEKYSTGLNLSQVG